MSTACSWVYWEHGVTAGLQQRTVDVTFGVSLRCFCMMAAVVVVVVVVVLSILIRGRPSRAKVC